MIFRSIFFIVASMAINYIFANIFYFKDTHCIVKFEGLILTGSQFLLANAVSGLILSLM